jgi:hypothetical protein
MPNINLRDGRNRDALVRADSVRQTATVRYVDDKGGKVQLRKVLKGTLDNGLDALLAANDRDLDKVSAALLVGDPEIDMERAGTFILDSARVYVNTDNRIVYRIVQTEVVRGTDGVERERRAKKRVAGNVDGEIPLTWSGRKVKKADALARFVFHSKLQIVHVNGLTYDFLYGIAKDLAEADNLMLLGAGASGKEPLILRHGTTPCRGFLEGRVDGDKYVLLLHLSKMELKAPPPVVAPVIAPEATVVAAQPVPAPAPQPASPQATAEIPAVKKPTVAEVLAATASVAPTPEVPAKAVIADTLADAKTSKRKSKAPVVASAAAQPTERAPPDDTAAKPVKKRTSRAKPAADAKPT